jgi:hypothetical protein
VAVLHRWDPYPFDYQVNQLALQYLIAWHRDTHGPACRCVQDAEPVVQTLLGTLTHDLAASIADPHYCPVVPLGVGSGVPAM